MTMFRIADTSHRAEALRISRAFGALLVFRGEMRGRKPMFLLLQVFGLLAGVFALTLVWSHGGTLSVGMASGARKAAEEYADLIQLLPIGPANLYRTFVLGLVVMPILFMPCAAVLSAVSAPRAEEDEKIQSLFLTRLTPFDLALGRIAAGLLPLLIAQGVYCAGWIVVLAASGFSGHTALSFFVAHCVVLGAVFMTGAVAFLVALRRKGGRAWTRGAGVATLLSAVTILGLFLVNPKVKAMDDPTALIERALLVNPVVATGSAFKLDLLRTPLVYDRTDAPEYPFRYPVPLASAGLFGGVGMAAVLLSAARLRRMYQ